MRFYEITKNAVREAIEQSERRQRQPRQRAAGAPRARLPRRLQPVAAPVEEDQAGALGRPRAERRAAPDLRARSGDPELPSAWSTGPSRPTRPRTSARFPARLIEYRGEKVEADTQKGRFTVTNEAQAREVERTISAAAGGVLTVEGVERKPKRRNPPPPFTTSTLQQEAARKLGFTARRTMQTAQRALRVGLHHLHAHRLGVALERRDRRDPRHDPRAASAEKALSDGVIEYKTKSKNAQEAHEAIRPTVGRRDAAKGGT